MENLGEALKIGFAIALFVMALGLSMSSFSQATTAVKTIISERDRDVMLETATLEDLKNAGYEQYVYVEPSPSDTRIVGIESVVSTINRAMQENIEIHFLKVDASGNTNPYDIHKLNVFNSDLKPYIIDFTTITSIGENGIGMHSEEFVKILFAGTDLERNNCDGITYQNDTEWEDFKNDCSSYLVYANGLYDQLKNYKFEELIGEYYLGTGTSEYKKVVITYVIQP